MTVSQSLVSFTLLGTQAFSGLVVEFKFMMLDADYTILMLKNL